MTDEIMSRREAVEKAARYHDLKLSIAQTERMARDLGDELRAYIEVTGEPISGEGFPPLALVPRRTMTYDLQGMHERAPETFDRLLALGCLGVNMTALRAQQRAGNVTGTDGYAMHGETWALVFGREAP